MSAMDFDWQTLLSNGDLGGGNAQQGHQSPSLHPTQQPSPLPLAQAHAMEQGQPAETSNGAALAPPQTRLIRPASSSSHPSVASSPGPIRHHSPPGQQMRSNSRRAKSRRIAMDVKVLYTLDSHPNSTLVASLGRPTSVQVVSFGKREKDGRASSMFGKVTLKTCLGAICMASPELMIDGRQDYILYAVDPIESYRAGQRRNGAASAAAHTKEVDSKRAGKTSASGEDQKQSDPAGSAFVVGKGFFTWALAEQGEGQSLVHGRVRSEYDDDDDGESGSGSGEDEEDLEGKVLEVSLRLKAASSTSRDQYFDRVKSFQSANTSIPSLVAEGKLDPSAAQSQWRKHAGESKGVRKGDGHGPQTVSSPVTASEREQTQAATSVASTPAQQQLLYFLQALQAQASSPSAHENPAESHAGQKEQTQGLDPSQQRHNAPSPDVVSHLLRSLAAPAQSSTKMERSPRLGGSAVLSGKPSSTSSTPRIPVSALPQPSKGAPSDAAASPILGGLTPGYEVDYLSGPSPAAGMKATVPVPKREADEGKVENKDEGKDSQGLAAARMRHRPAGSNRSKQCCYNCGVRSQRSWRHLIVTDEDSIRFKEGSVTYDHGKRLHRACNACGLYFNKYSGVSRPEHVWKEAHRQKREQRKEVDKKHGSKCNCSIGDERPLSPFEVWEQEGGEDEGGERAESSAVARTKQLARTLSEACERDSHRRISVCGEYESDQETVVGSAPARRVANFEEARLKDYVEDNEGVWRTKRSILENPENRRPGRPKGSKTGKGEGRPRERHLLGRNKDGRRVSAKAQARPMTASSPGAGAVTRVEEKKEAKASTGGAVSLLAQSSPVRPIVGGQYAKTPGSGTAVNRTRYGAANYLLDSSPATAFQTVLDEAETDWNALCGLSPRRSPRKKPMGTHGGLNPYATISPSSGKKGGAHAPIDLMKMASSSPLTRSRVKSGQYQLDDAWFSSEGFDLGGKKTGSSNLTSPASPSPSPAQLKSRGARKKNGPSEVMLQAGQVHSSGKREREKGGEDGLASAERARKAARQARQAAGGSAMAEAAVVDAGPFMGLGVADTTGADDEEDGDEDEAGRGSPTVGRSRRMGNKAGAPAVPLGSPTPSSAEPMLDFNQDWTRSSSLRELFPTPSPIKQWTVTSPSHGLWQSPTSWTVKHPALSPVKVEVVETEKGKEAEEKSGTGTALMPLDVNAPHQLVRRKPLAATVEDASSSVGSASSSPMEEDEGDEGGNGLDVFEDPYGLLAASGIGVQGNQPGLSMEDFESIELFQGVDFTQQLDFFTQMGSNGIAAHLAPASQGSSATTSTLKIEGKAKAKVGEIDGSTLPSSNALAAPSPSSTTVNADFAALLKDPAMQAILAHMHVSPSKSKQSVQASSAPPAQ